MLGRLPFRAAVLLAAWLLCPVVGLPAGAQAASFVYDLHNHPDGSVAPPLYGLRLDGLLSGDSADIFTFDFDDSGSSVSLVYDDGAMTVRISGTVFGGLDSGSSYDPQLSGHWALDFTYTANVTSTSDGSNIVVTGDDPTNAGTIQPLDVPGLPQGPPIALVDETGSHSFSFKFNNTEDHRLDGSGLSGPETFVGYGWLNHSGEEHIKASDWLFTGVKVPEPSLMILLGGLGLAPRLRGSRQNAQRRPDDQARGRRSPPSL